jgi:hypothetical protein
MIALEFGGFGSQPGNGLGECLDAAGVDARLGQLRPADADVVASRWNDALADRRTDCRALP